ncbi:hypothetical protein L211DRAFT_212698 [Terfezia boudieri ATCC MYA-4762]|uniref:Uncharacterized protein n=1 Tax=Terfezia boudieri ATCC MYA-4762 TaxID=1051890 RepID=A0A3N4LRK5_9PEZI|nr:hypothetical protein L211DRAFT_212698 [Terfezia boudieri ATCC MYA-4762]
MHIYNNAISFAAHKHAKKPDYRYTQSQHLSSNNVTSHILPISPSIPICLCASLSQSTSSSRPAVNPPAFSPNGFQSSNSPGPTDPASLPGPLDSASSPPGLSAGVYTGVSLLPKSAPVRSMTVASELLGATNTENCSRSAKQCRIVFGLIERSQSLLLGGVGSWSLIGTLSIPPMGVSSFLVVFPILGGMVLPPEAGRGVRAPPVGLVGLPGVSPNLAGVTPASMGVVLAP